MDQDQKDIEENEQEEKEDDENAHQQDSPAIVEDLPEQPP